MKRDLCELYSNIKSCNGENSCLMAIVFFFWLMVRRLLHQPTTSFSYLSLSPPCQQKSYVTFYEMTFKMAYLAFFRSHGPLNFRPS